MAFTKGNIAWNKGLNRTWASPTEFKKGNTPWNKDLKGVQIAWNKGKEFTKETREKMRISAKKRKRLPLSDDTKRKIRLSNIGKKASKDTLEKLKKSHLGNKLSKEAVAKRKDTIKDKKKKFGSMFNNPLERNEKIKKVKIRQWADPEFKNQMFGKCFATTPEVRSERMKNIWSNRTKEEKDKIIKKIHSCKNPNKKELKLFCYADEVCPNEYVLNTRGEILILGGKIPDFVNINGKKKLIELYGDFWHRNDNPQDRIDYFKQFGWDTLVIWESELKDREILKEKILNF